MTPAGRPAVRRDLCLIANMTNLTDAGVATSPPSRHDFRTSSLGIPAKRLALTGWLAPGQQRLRNDPFFCREQ